MYFSCFIKYCVNVIINTEYPACSQKNLPRFHLVAFLISEINSKLDAKTKMISHICTFSSTARKYISFYLHHIMETWC